jgi:hypothetical protein
MRTRLVVALAVGALGIVAVACSSSSSSSTPAPPDSTVSAFCGDWGTAVCQASGFCMFDATACATYQTTVCTQFASAATASGTRTYNQPGGKACIDALSAAYGGIANNPSLSAASVATLQDTCNKAFTGNVASDGNCTSNYDCASGQSLTCSPIPGGTTSVCASGNSKALGAVCSAGDTCQGDSYCAPVNGKEPQCTADPAQGGACSASVPCGAADTCSSGTCQPKIAEGDPCTQNSDCTTGFCDTYSPAACATALTFARGSYDCKGIAGIDQTGADAGVNQDSGGGGTEASVEASSGDAAGE